MNKTLRPLFLAMYICLHGLLFSQNEINSQTPYNYNKIEFATLPNLEEIDELTRHGVHLLDFCHPSTYTVAIPKELPGTFFNKYNIKSKSSLTLFNKLSNKLLAGYVPDYAVSKNKIECIIKYHKNISHEDIIRTCNSEQINILTENKVNNFLRVNIHKSRIKEIAQKDFVAFIDIVPPPSTPDDEHGRAMHRSNSINTNYAAGRKYNGEGINILCRDDGLVGPHIDFKGRINNSFIDNASNYGGSHGDAVSGIMTGGGNLNPRNIGMAPGANLFVIDYESDFLDETMQLHIENEILITNSSYSNGCNAGYTLVTETVDQQLFNYPKLMHVFSAGNSNQLDCGYGAGHEWGNITGGHKQAKNCITVSNLNPDGTLANSSSRGPAHDGRIKPDISAFGEGHVSTDSENTYQIFGGTSAAAPGVAGVLAQLQHAYKLLNNGSIADGALLKAAILNTANDLGNPGPDFKFGWGQINAFRAVKIIEENYYLNSTVIPFQTKIHSLQIPENIKEARVMLYWQDREASYMADKALVNNLDLKVIDENGNEYFPWVLDSTTDPINLDMAATTGIDNLNNVEQVFLEQPAAGNYTIEIFGKEMPFGQLPYYIVWEFRTDEIEITHPMGGESFEPGENITIHWDGVATLDSYSISYSADGGLTFENIVALPGNKNKYEWIVPNKITGDALIEIKNTKTGVSTINQFPFSIATEPKNLEVTKACPDFITLKWNPVDFGINNNVVEYEIYLLGDKNMELIGKTTSSQFPVPTINNDPSKEYWMAVRATGEGDLHSERTEAILYNDGLLNCQQEHDLYITEIISPNEGTLFGCGSESLIVQVIIQNNGLYEESNFPVVYQVNNQPPIIENFNGTIYPGTNSIFTFSKEINLIGDKEINLKTYTDLNNDIATFNNLQEIDFTLALYNGPGEPLNYNEDFNTPFLPPPFYAIENPDSDLTWADREVIGINGSSTKSMFINNYSYASIGEEDAFLVVPVDLIEAQSPLLFFDVAYAQYSNNYSDGLRVEISSDCGQSFNNIIFEKHGTELATAPNHNQLFLPESESEWRTETINLKDYSGNTVVLKFVNITGYGNSLFIDNIKIEEFEQPAAGFKSSELKICQGEIISFVDNSVGNNLNYNWNFGELASPNHYSQPGPINVEFSQPGNYTITLTVSNEIGASTFSQIIEVQPPVNTSFNHEINNFAVTFINESENADNYFWNFGDGNTSIEFNPTHHYGSSGNYLVALIAENSCGQFLIENNIQISVNDLSEEIKSKKGILFPNPADNNLTIEFTEIISPVYISIKNISGKVVDKYSFNDHTVLSYFTFDVSNYSEGIYFVEIKSQKLNQVLKCVIAH